MPVQKPRRNPEPVVHWQGRSLTIAAASALAASEYQRGNSQAFVDIYGLILAQLPDFAEGHNNRGAVLQTLGRFEEALASYDRAIALKPAYANAHFNRGIVLKKLLRREEAVASYDRAISLNPNHAEAYNNRGVVLQELKRYHEAIASYDRAIALKPTFAEAFNNRGIVLAGRGDMAGAEKMFAEATRLKPDFADPLFNLVNIRNYESADAVEVKNISSLLQKPNLSEETKEHLLFSLGKVFDDCGRYDEAFEHFRRANELRNKQVAYDAGLIERNTEATIATFTRELLSVRASYASNNRSPIFIIGMPRSGTTLLASILSNHPAIATAGELSTMADFAFQLPQMLKVETPYPEAVKHLTAEAAQAIINGYEKRLRRDFGSEIAHVVDKNPLNFRHVGFISMLFPEAKILHCTRRPIATCLSNYFQRFPLTMDYSFDLGNIAHFYREYTRLMDHWRGISTLKILEVSYEDMILNTEQTARNVVARLDLEWNEGCLAPHTNKYSVETASQWQVRQPIYQRALDNWRHYEKHLAALNDAVGRPGP